MLFITHDLPSMSKGDAVENFIFAWSPFIVAPGYYNFSVEEVESGFDGLSVHSEHRDWFFRYELYTWFWDGMGKVEVAFDLVYFVVIYYLVQFIVVWVIDFFESM